MTTPLGVQATVDTTPPPSWEGFLARVAPGLDRVVEPRLFRVAVAAMAATRGPRAALEHLLQNGALGTPVAEIAAAAADLALRCALDGAYWPAQVRALVPTSTRDPGWRRVAIALRRYRESDNDGAVVHLTGAVVAVLARTRLRSAARRHGLPFPTRPAGRLAVLDQLHASRFDLLARPLPSPDPLLPDETEAARQVLTLARGSLAWEILLDPALCAAALFVKRGHPLSARSVLAGARPSPAVQCALAWPPFGAWDVCAQATPRWPAEDDRLYEGLVATPDPSLLLAAPWWKVAGGWASTKSRLLRQGRGEEAARLRTLLMSPALCDELEPWWVLRREHDEDVVAAARRLPAREDRCPT